MIKGLKGSALLEVYTAQGKMVYDEKISLLPGSDFSSSLMLKRGAPGIYYLKLTNNEAVILKKLIIQ